MKIPKKFKRIGDKKPCHLVGVVMDGDTQVIIYKQWIPWKRYYSYSAVSGDSLYDELYYKRYHKFPSPTIGINNVVSPVLKLTIYKDCNGRRVRLGDWIKFLFWQTGSDGLQHEVYRFGQICRNHRGYLVFRYKPDGKIWMEKMLDRLTFDSTMEWEVYCSPSQKIIK